MSEMKPTSTLITFDGYKIFASEGMAPSQLAVYIGIRDALNEVIARFEAGEHEGMGIVSEGGARAIKPTGPVS